MKILFASDDPRLESKIAKRFGHANYYIIYDLEKNDYEAVKNPGHGEKHEILAELVKQGVKIFIVGNIGPGAFETASEAGAEIYFARLMTVKEALEKFKNNSLEKLDNPTLKHSIEKH